MTAAANTNIDQFIAGETDAFGGPPAENKQVSANLFIGSALALVAAVVLVLGGFGIANIVMSKRSAEPTLPPIATPALVSPPEMAKPVQQTPVGVRVTAAGPLRGEGGSAPPPSQPYHAQSPPEIAKATTSTSESQAELSRLRAELDRIEVERDVLRWMVKHPAAQRHRKVYRAIAPTPEVAPISTYGFFPCPPSIPCRPLP